MMLRTEHNNGVLLLTLDRPEKRNALHPDLIRLLQQALSHAATDESVNAVLLTGAGASFCAGLDLDQLIELDLEGKVRYFKAVFELFEQLYVLPQPVIAAINGPAIAGGFDLAVLSDLRLCVPTATFGQAEILLGITQMIFPLHQMVGLGRAKELALTGDPISAEEAYRIGLVNRICPPAELIAQAHKLAVRLTSRPPRALRETKRLSRELVQPDFQPAFNHMFATIVERLRSEEHRKEISKYVAHFRHRSVS